MNKTSDAPELPPSVDSLIEQHWGPVHLQSDLHIALLRKLVSAALAARQPKPVAPWPKSAEYAGWKDAQPPADLKDAQRYQWLHGHMWNQSHSTIYRLPMRWGDDFPGEAGNSMDAAIDRAMLSSAPTGEAK